MIKRFRCSTSVSWP